MSTLIDDWDEQALFEGMPVGSLGPAYTFNDGRCQIWWDDGSDLRVEDFGAQGSGLHVPNFQSSLLMSYFCPTLAITLNFFNGEETTKIEIGRIEGDGSVSWNSKPIFEFRGWQDIDPKLYTQRTLKKTNLLRFRGHQAFIKSISVFDCSECKDIAPC